MLFALKRSWWHAVAAGLLLLAARAIIRHPARQRRRRPPVAHPAAPAIVTGLLTVFTSDAILHVILSRLWGDAYTRRYAELVRYFERQGAKEIVAGGMLAAVEEVWFRGYLLDRLEPGLGQVRAIATAGGAFALAHVIPRRRLFPFSLWALWEGILLGAVYFRSRSLAVVMAVHALHDSLGFLLFFVQRKTGLLLSET